MPYVKNLQIMSATSKQKAQIVKNITNSLVNVSSKKRQNS